MYVFLLLFLLLFVPLFPEEPQEADLILEESILTREPSTIVEGCSVISGDYFDVQTDLIVPGAQPISIQRAYSSAYVDMSADPEQYLCHGWYFNHDGALNIVKEGKKRILSKEGLGMHLLYDATEEDFQLSSQVTKKGLTNWGRGTNSGQTNIKNQVISWADDQKRLKMTLGSGAIRTYTPIKTNRFALSKERRPGGNLLTYSHDDYHRLLTVKARNAANDKLSEVSINYPAKKEFKKIQQITVEASNQTQAIYQFIRLDGYYFLSRATRPEAPPENYYYAPRQKKSGYHLIGKERADGRYQKISYYHKGVNDFGNGQITTIPSNKDHRIDRVSMLEAPVGTDKTLIMTHHFSYHIPLDKYEKRAGGGITGVYDAYWRHTDYAYDESFRLSSVTKFSSGRPLRKEQFFWGQQPSNEGNLISRTLEGDNITHFCQYFVYDKRGNVLKEQLFGNLTGENNSPVTVNAFGVPQSGCESYSKEFSYSSSGFNVLKEERLGRQISRYTYYPNTDLVKSHLIYDGDKIVERKFFDYDSNGVLCNEIHDDGDTNDKENLFGVSERYIKKIQSKTKALIGLPKVIENFGLNLETGALQLINRKVNSYSDVGRLIHEEHLDSNGNPAYTLHWEYDSQGNVTKEINAVGNTIIRRYDENNNCIYEQGPSQEFHTEYTYDFANRLIKKDKVLANGKHFVESYRYNYLNEKIALTDIYGQEARYEYDEYGNIIAIYYPEIITDQGLVCPIARKEYNALGHAVTAIDPNGNRTSFQYTIRGKPSRIQYADGSVESHHYSLDGYLERSIAKNGTKTEYRRDYQGRVTQELVYSPDGEFLKSKQYRYNSFHCLSETDENGLITNYSYDFAGRLLSISRGNHLTTYEYDALGRKSCVKEHLENTYSSKVYAYDLLDRIIEEHVEDSFGNRSQKITYSYDCEGHVILNKVFTNDGEASTYTAYNIFGDIVSITDPENKTRHTTYSYNHRNEFGQSVAYSQTTDPLGNISKTCYDTAGNVSRVQHLDQFGAILQQRDYRYDCCHNCTSITISSEIDTLPANQVTTKWQWDCLNRVSAIVEASGTPLQKCTYERYSHSGYKEATIKPDGTVISYTYNALGLLEERSASDRSFCYRYAYDLKGNPTLVTDRLTNQITIRTYDLYDQLTAETLANGLTLIYAYDEKSRPILVTLPDQSQIAYRYDSTYLKEIVRQKGGEVLYRHTITEYDVRGHSTDATLIGNAGQMQLHYDLMDRMTDVTAPHWQQNIPSGGYDAAGNLIKREQTDSLGQASHNYFYDEIHQLKSEAGHHYGNDARGNRLYKDQQAYVVNALNQIENDSQYIYGYSLNGNLISKTSDSCKIAYRYDALDRLVAVTEGTSETRYTYDAFNRRLTKTNFKLEKDNWQEKNTETYLYQGTLEIGAYSNDQVVEMRILAPSKQAVACELQGHLYAPIHDQMGNVVCLIDADNGKVIETYRYTAFGEEEIYNANGVQTDQAINPWRFAGKRTDPETGFIYFGMRYYAPTLGRWTSPDPAGFIDGENLYRYLKNNPFKYVDPDGRAAFLLIWPIISIAFGIETSVVITSAWTFLGIAAGAAIGYGAHELCTYVNEHDAASHEHYTMPRKKKGESKDDLPTDPLNDPNFEDITRPELEGKGHHELKDKRTGEVYRYDEGKPGRPGHEGKDHFHWIKKDPNGKEVYLNGKGTPVEKGSDASHLYPPAWYNN